MPTKTAAKFPEFHEPLGLCIQDAAIMFQRILFPTNQQSTIYLYFSAALISFSLCIAQFTIENSFISRLN